MTYFVTGGTGFIGRHLIDELLKRKGDVYVMVRRGSKAKFKELVDTRWSASRERVLPIFGDLTKRELGLSKKDLEKLSGKVTHFFHLAAVYDLTADTLTNEQANIEGTRHAIACAERLKVKCFHHASSIAVAGLYQGTFREDMFEEATGLHHAYFRSKHEAEALVRNNCTVGFRIYRPGIVVGHSKTGEIDKIDGPYYFFKLIQKMRRMLPAWVPTLGIEGGRVNLVPVDYVARAMDHIAHQPKLNGKCFHLTDPNPKRIGEVMNIFANAAHAPLMSMRIDARLFSFIPSPVKQGLGMLPPVRRIINQVLADLGIPKEMMSFFSYPTHFDTREAERALKGSGIEVPPLEDYAWTLWDYWERHLDPELFIDRSLSGQVRGKRVMVTGASSGIGRATALMMGKAGAQVICVARGKESLDETQAEIEALGGVAHCYVCDLSDESAIDKLVSRVTKDHGGVDILVNNAGRSIRRSIALSYDRFHDYTRCMQLNYFGALKLIMGFLPAMQSQGGGQIINISSIGVLTNAPRFSAYVASKAALDAFSRCAAAEFNDTGISFTTINMPLVKTPMIAPTKLYQSAPTITPEDAADMVKQAIIFKPQRIATRLGIFAQVLHAVAPKISEIVMNSAFRMFPDSAAARGELDSKEPTQMTQEQMALASLMRGIHW
jgi:NAD(P)-dependent dehydrogenase (short-subunit alcohol dehydrogenase family)